MTDEQIKKGAELQPEQTYGENASSSASSTPTSASYYDPKKEIEILREQSKEGLRTVNYIMFGLIVFVAITFLIVIYTMSMDRIKDKDIYLRYTDLSQKYTAENDKMKDEVNNQKIEVNNFKNQIELLKAKNPHLK